MAARACIICYGSGKVICHRCGGDGHHVGKSGDRIERIVCDGAGVLPCRDCGWVR
jgi:hypothetical protein